MKFIQHPAGGIYATDAANWLGWPKRKQLQIAITTDALKRRMTRGLRWQLGQLYGIVGPGAINVEFAYRGLKRRMFVAENPNADSEKFALTWRPAFDFRLAGDKFSPTLERYNAPEGCMFVAYVSPNHMAERFPDVDGWLEHWTWIDEDPANAGKPVDWESRYESCVWAK